MPYAPAFWAGWWLFPLVMVALMVIALLVMRSIVGGPAAARSDGQNDPLEVLRRRYAAGEISSEQFEDMRNRLRR